MLYRSNTVSQTGQIRRHGNKKREERTPVDAVPVRIPAIRVIQRRDIDILFLNEPVIGSQDARDGSEEDGVAAHESEEGFRGRQDLPGDDDPATDEGGDNAAALDVDVAREEDREVVGGGDGVCGDVRANLGDVPTCRCEESCGSTAVAAREPFGDDVKGVPDQCSVNDAGCGSGDDTDDRAEREDDGEEGKLDELAFGGFSISREIGDVAGEGGPGAGDGGHGGEEEVGFLRAGDGGFEGEDLARAAGFVDTPAHGGEGGDGGGDEFQGEEVAEFGWGDEEEGKLDDPEDKVARCVRRALFY